MSPKTKRVIGVILIAAAIVGWLICLTSLITIWVVRPSLTETVTTQVSGIKATLEITAQGLEVTQKSIGAVITGLETLQNTVQTTADVINGTTPFLNSLIGITDQSLPDTVAGLKGGLEKAQAGAQVIDDALRKVTSLPLIGEYLSGKGYNPETPLDKGLSEAIDKVANLEDTFQGMTDSLSNTRDNVQAVQQGIDTMAANIGEIRTNLEETQQALKQYQQAALGIVAFLEKWGDRLPQIILLLAVLFSILFIWIAATQLGLFLQGLENYRFRE